MDSPAVSTGHDVATIYWDISARCNGRCAYCSAATALEGATPEPIGTEEARRGLRRLRRGGAAGLVFLGGEPTLREDLGDLVGAALDLGLSVSVATNGLAWPGHTRRRFLEQPEGLAVNFSLDSDDPHENDAARGSGYHAACTRTLTGLLADRRATGAPVRVSIQCTLTRLNLGRIDQVLGRMLELGADSVLLDRMKPYPWHSREIRSLAPEPAEWIAAAGRAARVAIAAGGERRVRINYGMAHLRAALAERYGYAIAPERTCPGGLEAAVVDFRGYLHPCRAAAAGPAPADEHGRPHYTVQPLSIRSPQAARFLQSEYFVDFFNFAHSARTYEHLRTCRECEYYTICEPCPLDGARRSDLVARECRALAAGCLP